MNGSPVDSVYNLKRRMASLPPISADAYAENVATSLVSSKQESLDAASSSAVVRPSPEEERAEESDEFEDLIGEQAQINCCLFCTKDSDSLETNLEHMSSEHGLYIPEIEHLSSLETIVGYLRTVITKYNECLYCGMIKQSAEGIRQHMLDKGHCMINLEREPELLEFWEFSDSDGHDTDDEEALKSRARKTDTAASRDLSQGEYTLPSGKVVGSKSKAREARLFARRTALAAKETSSRMITEGPIDDTDITSSADPAESLIRTQGGTQDRAVAVRDAVGLVGVSEQQMRSLITVQRKMQRQQAIVRASAAWAGEKGGTHQKHYKVKMNLRAG
jgi:pre-60S factor REI1